MTAYSLLFLALKISDQPHGKARAIISAFGADVALAEEEASGFFDISFIICAFVVTFPVFAVLTKRKRGISSCLLLH